VLPSQVVGVFDESNFVEVNCEKEEELTHEKCFEIYIASSALDPVLKRKGQYKKSL
jgi:hypothetical protein